jgi:glycosyltransferase involved in cell wall biosynthesis
MSAVNAAVYEQFRRNEASVSVIDISAQNLDRSFFMRLGRLPRVCTGLMRLLFHPDFRGDSLYMSISGGFGQLYELCFLLIARLRGMRIYLHHHSFAYLDRYQPVTGALTRIAGASGMHITLSPGMAGRLRERYSAVRRAVPVSNVVFFPDGSTSGSGARTRLRTLGFLSNISAEKGIFDFLDLVAACEKAGLPLRARIAGPFQDAETERLVRRRLGAVTTAEYTGPRYGEDKAAFLDSIDVLVFPTRYANEAEPLTLHEAMRNHVPVIAYGRGSVPEIVAPACGLVVDPAMPFVPAAISQLQTWIDNPPSYRAASAAAGERFCAALDGNLLRWRDLSGEILGRPVPV